MKPRNPCIVSARVDKRSCPAPAPAPAPMFKIRSNPNPHPMATRIDLPRPEEVTPVAPIVTDPDPDNRIMDLKELAITINNQTGRLIVRGLVAMAVVILIAAIWRML